jgi:Ankyrin repeats (3 copies)
MLLPIDILFQSWFHLIKVYTTQLVIKCGNFMNKKTLLLCISLTSTCIIFSQNNTASIKHITAEEQAQSQLQERVPLSNKQQQNLNSLATSFLPLKEDLPQVDRETEQVIYQKQKISLPQDNSWITKVSLIAGGFVFSIYCAWQRLKHSPLFTKKSHTPQEASSSSSKLPPPFSHESFPSSSTRSATSLSSTTSPYVPATTTSQSSSNWLSIVSNLYRFFLKKSQNSQWLELFIQYEKQACASFRELQERDPKPLMAEIKRLENQIDQKFKDFSSIATEPEKAMKRTMLDELFDEIKQKMLTLETECATIEQGREELKRKLLEQFKQNVNSLIKQGANINARLTGGSTPLMLACQLLVNNRRGDTELIQFLLDTGAQQSIDTNDNNGETVLSIVAINLNKDLTKTTQLLLINILLKYNAKTEHIKNNNSRSLTEKFITQHQASLEMLKNATPADIHEFYIKT